MVAIDWMKQSDDMFKGWTETQRKMWQDWVRAVQGFEPAQPHAMWTTTVEAWQESVKTALDAQVDWTRNWAETFTAGKGTPDEVAKWANQGQEAIQHWSKVQVDLWEKWFEVVKTLDATTRAGTWDREGKKLLQIWQTATQKGINAQMEFLDLWTKQQADEKPKAEKKKK